MAEQASGAMATTFGRLAGTWSGTNGFRLMPTVELHVAPATAELATAAGRDVALLSIRVFRRSERILLTLSRKPSDGRQAGAAARTALIAQCQRVPPM